MQPVTTSRDDRLRLPSRCSMVSMLSRRASSMNAHVLTTTTSARDGSSVGSRPWAASVPAIFSESTWFLGQPRVSM